MPQHDADDQTRTHPVPPSLGPAERDELGGAADWPDIRRLAHFEIVRELGRGGQSCVYLARDTRLDRDVALKVLTARASFATDAQARFEREALVGSRIHHPGVCPIYELGTDQGIPYIAMGYVEGKPLSLVIRGRSDDEAECGPARGWPWTSDLDQDIMLVEETCRAVDAIHELGIVHRDLKPSNIMVRPSGSPVILDMGLAITVDETDPITVAGQFVGTPAYVAPELLGGARVPSRASDVYSLGAVLYELVAGRRPHHADSLQELLTRVMTHEPDAPRTLNADVSRDLETVILKALEKSRDRRYQSALALAEDLRRAREGRPITARPPSLPTRARDWGRRHPFLAAVSVAVPVLLLLLGVVVSEQRRRAESDVRAAQSREDAARAVEALVRLADGDRPVEVRIAAVRALGGLGPAGGPRCRAALEKASREPDPVGAAARYALERLRRGR